MKHPSLRARARRIKAIVADVDGVLTDGGIVYGQNNLELKRFHVQDGLAVQLARRGGLKIILASGRSSAALRRRSRELGVDALWQGAADKARIFAILMDTYRLHPREICCIGDDLPDLPLLRRAGLGVAVPAAADDVRRAAAMITRRGGGGGALREVVEFILKAQGKWNGLLNAYTR
ncbi:MAG: HAD hydrolase family protein [Candidatus Aureabacteria bacterium]|nr:HAD hydrolase family protein [Candidatus Auribacterota bacterium]